MVEIQRKINEIKQHISRSKGKKRLQYIKCLHRLNKQATEYQMNMKNYNKEVKK